MYRDKQEGNLVFDYQTDRYDIRFGVKDFYGGLHCGQCFDVKILSKWQPVRIEYSWDDEDWYLVGIDSDIDLQGLTVRI